VLQVASRCSGGNDGIVELSMRNGVISIRRINATRERTDGPMRARPADRGRGGGGKRANEREGVPVNDEVLVVVSDY
jgi:hypothetical protein